MCVTSKGHPVCHPPATLYHRTTDCHHHTSAYHSCTPLHSALSPLLVPCPISHAYPTPPAKDRIVRQESPRPSRRILRVVPAGTCLPSAPLLCTHTADDVLRMWLPLDPLQLSIFDLGANRTDNLENQLLSFDERGLVRPPAQCWSLMHTTVYDADVCLSKSRCRWHTFGQRLVFDKR